MARKGRLAVTKRLPAFCLSAGARHPDPGAAWLPNLQLRFSRLVPLLADRYQFFLFDYPGFGFSEKPRPYPYSLFSYADAAQALVAHFGLRRVWLLAHDIGDSVALELLHRAAPIVEQLVLLNGSVLSIPLDDAGMLLAQRLLLHPSIGPLLIRMGSLCRPTFAWMFGKLFFRALSPAEMTAFWSLLRYNDGVQIYHLLLRYMLERWQHQESHHVCKTMAGSYGHRGGKASRQ